MYTTVAHGFLTVPALGSSHSFPWISKQSQFTPKFLPMVEKQNGWRQESSFNIYHGLHSPLFLGVLPCLLCFLATGTWVIGSSSSSLSLTMPSEGTGLSQLATVLPVWLGIWPFCDLWPWRSWLAGLLFSLDLHNDQFKNDHYYQSSLDRMLDAAVTNFLQARYFNMSWQISVGSKLIL